MSNKPDPDLIYISSRSYPTMNISKHILLSSGFLKPLEKIIIESANIAIEKIQEKIRIENVDIVFFDQRDDYYSYAQVEPKTGLGQYAVGSHLIYVAIDAKLPTIKKEIGGSAFLAVLSHALYHSM